MVQDPVWVIPWLKDNRFTLEPPSNRFEAAASLLPTTSKPAKKLDAKMLFSLGTIILSLPCLTQLRLNSNPITAEGALALAGQLAKITYLQYVDLSGNGMHGSEETSELHRMLPSVPNVYVCMVHVQEPSRRLTCGCTNEYVLQISRIASFWVVQNLCLSDAQTYCSVNMGAHSPEQRGMHIL